VVDAITIDKRLESYIVDLVMATRKPADYKLPRLQSAIEFGASPRATIALNLASKAHAMLQKRTTVSVDDIKQVAPDILNHRIILSYEGEADGLTTRECIRQLLAAVPF
jgi:MoxR-like ATPase